MSADDRNQAKQKKTLHVLHIGKTGGTAVKSALERFPETAEFRIHLCTHHDTLRDVAEGDRVAFFVRDPLTRFVSGFHSRARQGKPRYVSPWTEAEENAFRDFQTPNALGEALSSPIATEREKAVHAMRAIGHVRASYWDWFETEAYFSSRRHDIYFIGFQESLDRDFAELRERLGLGPDCALPTDDVAAHRNPSGVDRHLSLRARRNLRQWYARDYAFLRVCRRMRREISCRDRRCSWLVSLFARSWR